MAALSLLAEDSTRKFRDMSAPWLSAFVKAARSRVKASNFSMRYIWLVVLLASSGFSQSTVAPPSAASIDQQNQAKARTVLDSAIQALGGPAYLNIQNITQEGRTYSFHLGNPTSAGLLFWRFYKYPDKDRIELTKKRDVAEVFNGEKGAEITYKGPRPMDTKELTDYLRRRQYALDQVLRKWINEPGVALFYDGPSVADQKPAEQVTVLNAQNQSVTLWVDANTHLPIKKSFSWRDPSDKQRNLEEEIYDMYRPVEGVMTPFVVTRYYNGDMSNQRFITTAAYNKNLNEALFNIEADQIARDGLKT